MAREENGHFGFGDTAREDKFNKVDEINETIENNKESEETVKSIDESTKGNSKEFKGDLANILENSDKGFVFRGWNIDKDTIDRIEVMTRGQKRGAAGRLVNYILKNGLDMIDKKGSM